MKVFLRHLIEKWKCPVCLAVIEGEKADMPNFIAWHIKKHEPQYEKP